MKTLEQFAREPTTLPMRTVWYLTELAEAKGRQALFIRQTPQRLKVLREHALIESAVSSNRIEGVTVEDSRIGTLMFGKPALHDRNEEEVKGYRDALNLLHQKGAGFPLSIDNIKHLHRLCRGETWDSGMFREKQVDIIQKYADGRQRVRFVTVAPEQTEPMMAQLCRLWQDGLKEKWVQPLALLAGMNLDFLCIHPFRDGNGRVSRLLLLQACYHLGFDVGRYISLEKIIEENKERYYETLEQSSQGWHAGEHNPWPYVNYLLFVLKEAYQRFEDRLSHIAPVSGEKADLVANAVQQFPRPFSLAELCAACPDVSRDWVRRQLQELKRQGLVDSTGHGAGARWSRKSE